MEPRRRSRKDDIEAVPEPEKLWNPVTELGKKVKAGEIADIDTIFNMGAPIQEAEIVNMLVPDLEEDLLLIGQAKGKFGGGQRRIFRQTQKKTREGNKIQFMTCAVVGNKNGYVGVACGKSKETVPARDKAKRKARLNLMRIRRGCGSWESDARDPNSIPFAVTGKCGSVEITLMPAPRGTGLCVEKECAKILAMAGIQDIRSKSKGQTKVKLNMISALLDALRKLSEVRIKPQDIATLGIIDGKTKGSEKPVETPEAIVEESAEVTEGKEEKTQTKAEA